MHIQKGKCAIAIMYARYLLPSSLHSDQYNTHYHGLIDLTHIEEFNIIDVLPV